MDEHVKSLLRQWELEELIPRFEEEEVNEKAFKCLSDDIIRELVPKLGKRALFNSAYRKYLAKQNENPDSLPQSDTTNGSPATAPIQHEKLSGETGETSNFKIEIIPLDGIKLESISTNDGSDLLPSNYSENENDVDVQDSNEHDMNSPKSIPFSIAPLENISEQDRKTADSLRTLLTNSPIVGCLLNKPFLTRRNRIALSDEIVKYLLDRNEDFVDFDVLERWARAVEIVFCDEITALYFRRANSGGYCGGKLYEAYQQLKNSKT